MKVIVTGEACAALTIEAALPPPRGVDTPIEWDRHAHRVGQTLPPSETDTPTE
jgi:hypothetical protein